MAGRGRGRGRNVSFNVEALGFGRGEALPGPILQPPPLFPARDFKPVPLETGEDYDYMVALKQEFRGTVRKSVFYLKPSEKAKDIERYSDKYQQAQEAAEKWTPDWRRLPAELKAKEKKARKTKSTVKPNLVARKKAKKAPEEIQKTLEALEKKELEDKDDEEDDNEDQQEEGEKEKKEEGVEEEEEDIIDEEELEEETDYIQSYFDNGEGYGDDDDDVDEGPVY